MNTRKKQSELIFIFIFLYSLKYFFFLPISNLANSGFGESCRAESSLFKDIYRVKRKRIIQNCFQ